MERVTNIHSAMIEPHFYIDKPKRLGFLDHFLLCLFSNNWTFPSLFLYFDYNNSLTYTKRLSQCSNSLNSKGIKKGEKKLLLRNHPFLEKMEISFFSWWKVWRYLFREDEGDDYEVGRRENSDDYQEGDRFWLESSLKHWILSNGYKLINAELQLFAHYHFGGLASSRLPSTMRTRPVL